MNLRTLTIVGVGLIGGSIGLAARKRGLAERVIGIGRQQSTLDRARTLGAIEETGLDLADVAPRSDFIVFCTPVDLIVEQVSSIAPLCRPGTILTDAGSTKSAIVRALEGRLPKGVDFVGSHPLAGSEKRGPDHAEARLFEQRLTVITPTAQTDPTAVTRTVAFWEALGSRTRLMSPEDHDRALALTSHLPHLLASSLAAILSPDLYDLTATGFRDTTRIAAGDASIWTGIFTQNRVAVLEALARLDDQLTAFRQALTAADRAALTDLLTHGKTVRDALGN